MDATFFLRGLIIGFSIAAPVGPIGVLCIRRTLVKEGYRASSPVSELPRPMLSTGVSPDSD